MTQHKVVTVFGGALPKPGSADYEIAETLGCLLAKAGYAVMTGGYAGTMEATSKGAKEAGGHVIGVTVEHLERHFGSKRNIYIDEIVHYETLSDRLYHLVTNCGAAIALPGGIGTLSEIALTWSLMQVGQMPSVPLVVIGQRWADTLNTMYGNGEYVRAEFMDLWRVAYTPAEAVTLIQNWK